MTGDTIIIAFSIAFTEDGSSANPQCSTQLLYLWDPFLMSPAKTPVSHPLQYGAVLTNLLMILSNLNDPKKNKKNEHNQSK